MQQQLCICLTSLQVGKPQRAGSWEGSSLTMAPKMISLNM